MTALVPIVAVAMVPHGSWAGTVAEDGTVRISTGASEYSLRLVRIKVRRPVAVALSASPLRVLWAAGRTLKLYEGVEEFRRRVTIFRVPAQIRALAISPSGDLAVVACSDGTLRSLNVSTGEIGRVLASEALTAQAVTIASDEGPVIAVFVDGSIRCYGLETRTSDIVGIAPQARSVAITPNGDIVITAGRDGIVSRWNRRLGAPPDKFQFDEAITAITVDSTGGKALVGTGVGEAWLLNLDDGSRSRHLFTVEVPRLSEPRDPEIRELWRPRDTADDDVRSVDNDVRFTVYRPQVLRPDVWTSLLVFAHKTNLQIEPGKAPIDPNDLVEARARAHFGSMTPRPVSEDARRELIRGAPLRIVPDLPGIRCNPTQAEINWWEPVHEVVFRLLARPDLAGTVVRGAVRIWCDPLILGEVSLAISIAANEAAAESQPVTDSAPRYRKIFPSYSHKDGAVVAAFAEAARAIGDRYLQDVLSLRTGERWEIRLQELIENADVFQLFWSRNSMYSRYCRIEWEHALALRRPSFIRPLYWEEPLPEDVGLGLPPAALRELHFVKVLVNKLALVLDQLFRGGYYSETHDLRDYLTYGDDDL